MSEATPLPELLRAAAVFLAERVGPALGADTPMAFRVRLVAQMLESAAAEAEEGPAILVEKREALARLLGVRADVPTLEHVLADRLRQNGDLTPDEEQRLRGYFLSALRGELRMLAPRFDTRLHPEEPHT
jgi:hypothetical protein